MLCSCLRVFFFFKQKTAYERRISDWSSDVCSSDLVTRFGRGQAAYAIGRAHSNRVRLHPSLRTRHPLTAREGLAFSPPPPVSGGRSRSRQSDRKSVV